MIYSKNSHAYPGLLYSLPLSKGTHDVIFMIYPLLVSPSVITLI